jgi:hypothetical protein
VKIRPIRVIRVPIVSTFFKAEIAANNPMCPISSYVYYVF